MREKLNEAETCLDDGKREIEAPEEDKNTRWFTGPCSRTPGMPFLAGNIKAEDEGKHIENRANGVWEDRHRWFGR